MNKQLLKKLIKEVIREANDTPSASVRTPIVEPPKKGEPPLDSPTPNLDKALQMALSKPVKDEVISLRIRGIKAGAPTLGEFIKDLMYNAKQDDLSLIRAEIKQKGGMPVTMDISALNKLIAAGEAGASKSQKPIKNLDPKFNFNNLEPDEQRQWVGKDQKQEVLDDLKTAPPEEVIRMVDDSLSKEEKKRLYKLACIRPGEKEEEWKAATGRDIEKEKEKTRLRASKLAAGTLKMDKMNRPVDTSLWTDHEWDDHTKGIPSVTGKGYSNDPEERPSFKKTDRTGGGKKVFAPVDYSKE